MKYIAKFTEIEAIRFDFTPEGVAALAAFAGDEFKGVSAEPNAQGKRVAKVSYAYATEGYMVYRKRDGKFATLHPTVFKMLFEQPRQDVTATVKPMLGLEAALQAAQEKAVPVPVAQPKPEPAKKPNIREAAQAAMATGVLTFTYHTPCKEGHTERYSNGGGCVECARTYQARWAKLQQRREASRISSRKHYEKKKAEASLRSPQARWLAPLVSKPTQQQSA